MVDGRADDRQAQRHIHRLSERQQLDGDQSLIVVARDHRVELSAQGSYEHGIRRKRPSDVDAAGPRLIDSRSQDILLLGADHPEAIESQYQLGVLLEHTGDEAGGTALLADGDLRSRQKAVYALWNLGPAADAASAPLAKAIGDDDPYVRSTAARSIPRLSADAVKSELPGIAAKLGDERVALIEEYANNFDKITDEVADKLAALAQKTGKKPNIIFVMGDDVGWFNIGAYHRGINRRSPL